MSMSSENMSDVVDDIMLDDTSDVQTVEGIPDQELGEFSPLKITCSDRKITLSDFIPSYQVPIAIRLLKRVFECEYSSDYLSFDEKEKMYLAELDKKLDIPRTCLVYLNTQEFEYDDKIKNESNYTKLKRLIKYSFSSIPPFLKTTAVKDLIVLHGDVETAKRYVEPFHYIGYWRTIVKHNHVKFAEWLIEKYQIDKHLKASLAIDAVRYGNYEMFLFLKDAWTDEMCNTASEYNQLKILNLLHSEFKTTGIKFWSGDACVRAAKKGYWKLLLWAKSKGAFISNWNADYAIRRGDIHALGIFTGIPMSDYEIYDRATKYGRINVIDWAVKHGHVWNEKAAEQAGFYGRLDVFEYLDKNGLKYDGKECLREVKRASREMERRFGHLWYKVDPDMWRKTHDMSGEVRDMMAPIIGGHYKLLNYLESRSGESC